MTGPRSLLEGVSASCHDYSYRDAKQARTPMTNATYRDTPLPGTTVFTGPRSAQGYKINKLAMSLTDPANRDAFKADERGYMKRFGLSQTEMDLIADRDWNGLVA